MPAAHSIAIYLAFFLPMAATRAALVRFGVIDDVGVAALIVTAVAVVAPLLVERLVRHTPAAFLFRRPAAFRIARRQTPDGAGRVAVLEARRDAGISVRPLPI